MTASVITNRPAIVVYSAATLQGFAFTLVPALATIFAAPPYRVDAQAFGTLFIPLTVGAVVAAAMTSAIERRFGTVGTLRIGIIANIIGLLALLGSIAVPGRWAYGFLLVDTAALGVGFGFNFSAVNELAPVLSENATQSVTLVNVLTGLGTALTPLFIGPLAAKGIWPAWPSLLTIAFISVFVISLGWGPARKKRDDVLKSRPLPRALILFGLAALLYAVCEGVYSSWATTFAHVERRFSLETGEAALSGFWLALTGTRFIASFTTRFLRPDVLFALFPIAIAITLLLLPMWTAAPFLIGGFILGGVACSIVFPYAMSLALAAMPEDQDRVAGVLVGALMTGEGLSTFVVGFLHSSLGVSLAMIYRVCAAVACALAITAITARIASPERAVKASR